MELIILSSLVFAILNVILFWSKSLAINFTIFSILFALSIILILKQNTKIKNKKSYILLIPIIILSLTYGIYNNYNLNMLNAIIIPVLDLIMAITLVGDKLNYKTTSKQIFYCILEVFSNIGNSFSEFGKFIDLKGKRKGSPDRDKINTILKATIITLFVALVIIGLLSSADDNFNRIFISIYEKLSKFIIEADLWTIIAKLVVVIFGFAILVSFYLYLIKKLEENQFESANEAKKEESLTVKMILLALNLIYLLFVFVQINTVLKYTGENVSVSGYAREGFFQLMLVSVINIITVLIAKSKWQENSKNTYIKINSIIMIVFTIILIALSFLRMNEYVKVFGLTFLRISVYFILLAEFIIMIPTLIYTLKGELNLNIVYFVVFLILYVVFNIINVNGIIGKTNIAKLEQTGKIDLYYLERLGVDETKYLLKCLESDKITVNQKHDISTILKGFEEKYNNLDIREFSLSDLSSYNNLKNSNYKDYIIQNKTLEEQQTEQRETTLENPYTSDSPVVDDNTLIAETFNFELGNNYTQEECNKIAKDYIQEIAKTSKVDWVKEYYQKFTVIYESKPVIGVYPNNYWELIRDGINAPDRNMKVETWTEGAYEVTLVRYDDDTQLERALVYVNPKTGKVSAGFEMGD